MRCAPDPAGELHIPSYLKRPIRGKERGNRQRREERKAGKGK